MRKMKYNKITVLAMGFCAVFILSLVACSTSGISKKQASPALSVTGNGVPGKVMEIKGKGFIPGEVIELVLEMEAVPIIVGKKGKTIEVKEDGTFEAVTNYPHKYVAIPGSWDLVATGDKGSKATCKVDIKSLR